MSQICSVFFGVVLRRTAPILFERRENLRMKHGILVALVFIAFLPLPVPVVWWQGVLGISLHH